MKSFIRGLMVTSSLCVVPMLVSAAGDGKFHIVNGQVIDPVGSVHIAAGINIDDNELTMAAPNPAGQAQPITTLFPGINHIRLRTGQLTNEGTSTATYPTAASFANFVNAMTALHIVVEIEDHSCNGGVWEPGRGGLAGQPCYLPQPGDPALAPITGFAAAIGNAYKTNPYVWMGSINEPNSNDGTYSQTAVASVSSHQKAVYDAFRGTGATNMMQMLAGIGGGNCGTVGANGGGSGPVALYGAMTGIVWELHAYKTDGVNVPNSGYTTAAAYLAGQVAAQCGGSGGSGYLGAQSIQSADGTVPVIYGEWGSGTGNATNGDASEMAAAIKAVALSKGFGSTGWGWYPSAQWQQVLNGFTDGLSVCNPVNVAGSCYSLTPWGVQQASVVQYVAGLNTPPAFTESANNTVILSATDPAIVGSTGEQWTLTSGGQVAKNGVVDTSTHNVVELAYVNHQIWQENTSALWWAKTLSTDAWSPAAGTATSPLPSGPSPEGAKVLAPSTVALNYLGSNWTIVSGQVYRDGAAISGSPSANVVEIEISGGTIWHKNATNQWFRWPTSAGWSPQEPIPVPAN